MCWQLRLDADLERLTKIDNIVNAVSQIRKETHKYYFKITGNNEVEQDIKKPRIVICVNRRTLTNKFYREYRRLGFVIHNGKSKEVIFGNRVIVCYPSLWRVMGEMGDDGIFILDEYC